MEERPPELRRYGHSTASRRVGALAGLLIGLGMLAAVVWVVGARGDEREAEPVVTTTPVTETVPPPEPTLRIVFPEGFTIDQMARRVTAVKRIARTRRNLEPALTARAYRKAVAAARPPQPFRGARPPRLEGFLFPATYEFTEKTTSRQLVRLQLEAFRRAWSEIDMGYARSRQLTPYDVLIIASMIEKEVQVPRERRLVAAVIYNRLRVGLPLGIDATIRYGLDIPPTQAILQSQLESDSPYNTRLYTGLPPTPIANPGLASMEAAARPADEDYLYFIRKADCKSHFFTASEEEFFNYPRAGLEC